MLGPRRVYVRIGSQNRTEAASVQNSPLKIFHLANFLNSALCGTQSLCQCLQLMQDELLSAQHLPCARWQPSNRDRHSIQALQWPNSVGFGL